MLQKQIVSVELINLLYDLQNEPLLKNYFLAGGTALALQLGHRTSTDIDLFTPKNQNNQLIINMLKDKYQYFELINISSSGLQVIIKKIKVDIISLNQNILEPPITEDGIRLFTKSDIAAMKLRAVIFRENPRDYIDLAFLLQEFSLDKMFDFYKQKYEEQNLTMLKLKLLACKDFKPDDWNNEINMIKNNINLMEIPKLFENELKKYNSKKNIGNSKTIFSKIGKLFNIHKSGR